MKQATRTSPPLIARFLGLMLMLAAAGIVLVAAFSHYQHSFDARDEARALAIDRALTVLDATETAATADSLSRFVFSTAAQPSIRAIALIDTDGRVVFASRHAWRDRPAETLTDTPLAPGLDLALDRRPVSHWDERFSQAVAALRIDPVNPASRAVRELAGGRLVLAFDATGLLNSAREEAWLDALWATGIMLLLMLTLTVVLHRRVGLPLQTVYQRARHPGARTSRQAAAMQRAPPELRVLDDAVTDLVATRQALDQERKRLEDIANTIPGAVYEYRHHHGPDDAFTFVSAGVRSLFGLTDAEMDQEGGATVGDLIWQRVLSEDHAALDEATALANRSPASEWEAEFRIRVGDEIRWIWGHAAPVDDPAPGQLFRGVMLDITERKHLQASLERAATHDPLTGILNRAGIEPLLETNFASAIRQEQPLAIAMLDIDHFKWVNDEFGHPMGDTILKELTESLSRRLRGSDSMARWGGEEFLVLLPHTGLGGARRLAEKLRRAVAAQSFAHDHPLTISIGVSTSREAESLEDLIQQADICLYEAKQRGRNRVVDTSQLGEAGS